MNEIMRYLDCDVNLDFGLYSNGNIGIDIEDADESSSLARVTANTDTVLQENHIAVKDYSENEGMMEWLEENGIAEDTGRRIPSGFVELKIAKLLVKPDFQ